MRQPNIETETEFLEAMRKMGDKTSGKVDESVQVDTPDLNETSLNETIKVIEDFVVIPPDTAQTRVNLVSSAGKETTFSDEVCCLPVKAKSHYVETVSKPTKKVEAITVDIVRKVVCEKKSLNIID